MQDGRAKGEAFGGIDDRVGIDPVVAIEVVDRAGLTKLLNAIIDAAESLTYGAPVLHRKMAV